MDNLIQKDEFEKLKEAFERKTKEVEIIKKISSQINKTLDTKFIAKALLEAMDEFFGFKYSMILLLDKKMQKLNVLATHGYENKGIGASVKLGIGVIGIVAKKKKMMRMANLGMQRSYMKAIKDQISPEEKKRLSDEIELPGLKNVESQVALPMLFDDELIGVLSVESEKVNIFDKSDELLIGILANQTANSLQNAKLYQLEQKSKSELNKVLSKLEILNTTLEKKVDERTKELVQLSKKLAKYFSPQVYQSIFSGKLDVKIQTKRKPLTVFFSDLEGFTELTERLEPEVLTEVLTQYLTEMSRIAIKWGGTIDKFIGDALLVFFGDPNTNGNKEDAIACVSMAIEMIQKLKNLRDFWREKGISKPLNARIGIHTGVCTVGNFGSEDRLDYTIIGNGVNLASRIETNAAPNRILVSEDTYLLIKKEVRCLKKQKISVKGISFPIQTYEVLGFAKEVSKNPLVIEKNIPGLTLSINKSEIEDNQTAINLIKDVLKNLKSNKTIIDN